MNDQITTYNFGDNFLERLADDIVREYDSASPGKDLRRLAIVFPGRRPALFLRRELARRVGKGFYSPKFFSIDEWMRRVVRRSDAFTPSKDLDQSFVLYRLAQKLAPEILAGRESFAAFLPWAREIQRFIEGLDLELVKDEALLHIEASAEIGYGVPEEINRLLEKIVSLRNGYHEHMRATKVYSRGFQYLRASELAAAEECSEFDEIFFCNFFYLNRCEALVIKSIYDRGKARLFFQGDEGQWPLLKNLAKQFGATVQEEGRPQQPSFELNLHKAIDSHSQAGMAKEILRGVKDLGRTVIVLPDTGQLIPLLSQLVVDFKDFNVSMGYPLRRSSLFSLLDFIFKAQISRRGETYYAHDYLRALRHPLVKNLKCSSSPVVTRVMVHKIEEILTGQLPQEISGQLFLRLADVASCDAIYESTEDTARAMGIAVHKGDVREILKTVHHLVFSGWEGLNDLNRFASTLNNVMDHFLHFSNLPEYPLNLKILERLRDLISEFQSAAFADARFPPEEIFKIFLSKIESEMMAFSGSPLKGLQILGLLETRALNFDNVIVLDVNEGVLPRLKVQDPLIPREVMLGLKLDRLEQEEEIQRYQFFRLLSSAKKVHLIYQENRQQERSRFVEELVWLREKASGQVMNDTARQAVFTVKPSMRQRRVQKTPDMIAFLREHTFSTSSINTYLRDPYEFYINYVLGLKEKEDLLEEPENRQVGTFVHELLEETYMNFVGRKPVIDETFKAYFHRRMEEKFDATFRRSMRSESFLLKAILKARLDRFLEAEAKRDVRELLFVEKEFRDTIPLSAGNVKFVYKLDRVDRLNDETVLVLDYKTGSVDPMPRAVDRIMQMELSRDAILENVKSFQIPLYFLFMDKHFPGERVNAAFYNLRTTDIDEFFGSKVKHDKTLVQQAFLRALDFIVSEILNPDVDFDESDLARNEFH